MLIRCATKIQKELLWLALASALIAAVPAHAQDATRLHQQFEQAFARMMENPGDIDATLHYANLATELNDYEAAIPALERILFFNPELADIRLQIGVMYQQLGSLDMAKEYFTATRNQPDAPLDVKERATAYLSALGG